VASARHCDEKKAGGDVGQSRLMEGEPGPLLVACPLDRFEDVCRDFRDADGVVSRANCALNVDQKPGEIGVADWAKVWTWSVPSRLRLRCRDRNKRLGADEKGRGHTSFCDGV